MLGGNYKKKEPSRGDKVIGTIGLAAIAGVVAWIMLRPFWVFYHNGISTEVAGATLSSIFALMIIHLLAFAVKSYGGRFNI
jgi:hypothetical protein